MSFSSIKRSHFFYWFEGWDVLDGGYCWGWAGTLPFKVGNLFAISGGTFKWVKTIPEGVDLCRLLAASDAFY